MRTNVTFTSAGITLAGHLYTPDTPADGLLPAVVVAHPASGVKEQTAGTYAARLADAGFVALTFDAAYQGESGGTPRGTEDPAQRVEDIKNAVSYLTTRPEIDSDRIGALGICASGGYVIPAAVTDHRVRAVATASAVDLGLNFRVGPDGTQDPAALQALLDAAAAARTAEAAGQPVPTLSVRTTEEEARAGGRYAHEGWEYYSTDRGRHPRQTDGFPFPSIDKIVNFDAFHLIDLLAPRPLLMIAGNEAATAWMSEEAIKKANEPKRLHWIEGASHVDLYDHYLPQVVTELVPFFTQNLAARATDAKV
ncbi:alpha/beta hydrolase [Streptomyces sp. NBC_00304]|uniref:alpha/beta hydrolase n=1 Tax=Streptomyces sp. NBC_00304 TaxID=2975706 RepID=UPI002E28639F|nr:alpha/beta hydrolase [Streptomyces sp. NBC_00304]